jgi:small conductance mechanosensitive channel
MSPTAVVIVTLIAGIARAQETAPAPGGVGSPKEEKAVEGGSASVKDLEDLVSTIEDPEKRARLLASLKTLLEAVRKEEGAPAAVQEKKGGLIAGLAGFFGQLSDQVKGTAIQLTDQFARLPGRARALARELEEPEARHRFLVSVATSLGTVVAAVVAGIVAWIPLRRLRARIGAARASGERRSFLSRLLRLGAVAILDAVPLLAFAFVGLVLTAAIVSPESARIVTLAVIWAVVFQRAVSIALEAVIASRHPALRVVPLGDETARSLAASLGRFVALGVYGHFTLQALAGLGAEDALTFPLRSLYGLILAAWGIVIVLRRRGPARAYLLSRAEGAGSWRSAAISAMGLWWLAAILYIVGLYMVWVSGAPGGSRFLVLATLKTLGAVAAAAILATLAARLASRFESRAGRFLPSYPEITARIPQYVRGAKVLAQTVLFIGAASLCLEAWGVSALDAIASPAAQEAIATAIRIVMIIVLATALIDVAAVFTQRFIEGREGTGRATGKVRTLVPLARKTVRAVVMIGAGIMILGQLGVEVGPILAGVGVLGLAIGFGAQTLVKDVITGVFMLIEDTLAVGDIVKLGDSAGVVEAIDIRTIRVRDGAGNVHTIPYSSVSTVINMSKDFSRHVIDATVAYREDVDEVTRILKEVGESLRADPDFGRNILEPIEVLGLERFDESSVVVRARLLTRPGQQFGVGREFNRRLKKAFDESGIEIPFPTRTLYFGVDKSGRAPPLHLETVEEGHEAPERLITEGESS